MSSIPQKLRSDLPFKGAYLAVWRHWRLPAGLALALSLLILALLLLGAYLGGDGAAASPLAQPYSLTMTRGGQSQCDTVFQSDSSYDPEMGCFSVNCSSCPISNTVYNWNRTPFYAEAHQLGPLPYNDFFFTLHRNKGCGDFQMWGMSGNDTVTNIAPFSIPCAGSLGDDTIGTTFSPGPGMLFFSPGQGGYDFATLFTEGPGTFSTTAQNRTATPMQVEMSALDVFSAVVLPGPQELLPGFTGNWNTTVQPNWSQVPQAMDVAAASPARVTGTLVFSFGPTARISRTLVVAQPQRVYVPLAAREWGTGW